MHVIKLFLAITSTLFVMQLLCRFLAPLHRLIGILVVSVVSGWRWACYIKRQENELDKVSPDGRAVFIAGADSESGYIACSKLAKYGYTVYGGAQQLSVELCNSLRRHSVDVLEFSPDTDESVEKLRADVVNKLTAVDLRLHAVICNLDNTVIGEMEWISSKRVSCAMEKGVVGTIRLVKAFLPLLRESRGRVIICSGLSGRSGIPGAALCSVANAALISVADCFRREMMKFRIPVALVEPIWINYRTPMCLLDTVTSKVNEVTNAMGYDLYQEYSKSYFIDFKNLWNRRIQRWYSEPADSVAVTICCAVNDTFVQPRYTCGLPWERRLFALLELLPDAVADIIVCFLYQAHVPISMNDEEWECATAGRDPLASRPGRLQTILQNVLSPGVSYAEHTPPASSPAVEAQMMKENAVGSKMEVPERDDSSLATHTWLAAQSEEWMPRRVAHSGIDSPGPLKLSSEEISSSPSKPSALASPRSSALSKGRPKKQQTVQHSIDRAEPQSSLSSQLPVQESQGRVAEHREAGTSAPSRVTDEVELGHDARGVLSADSMSPVSAEPTSLEEKPKVSAKLKVQMSPGRSSTGRSQEHQGYKVTTHIRKDDGVVAVKQPKAKERMPFDRVRSPSGSFQPLLETVTEVGTSGARQDADTGGSRQQGAATVYKRASQADEDSLPQPTLTAAPLNAIPDTSEVPGAMMEDRAPDSLEGQADARGANRESVLAAQATLTSTAYTAENSNEDLLPSSQSHPSGQQATTEALHGKTEVTVKEASLLVPEVGRVAPSSQATNGVRKDSSADMQGDLPQSLRLPSGGHKNREAVTESVKPQICGGTETAHKNRTLSSHTFEPEAKSQDLSRIQTTVHPPLPRGDAHTLLTSNVGSLHLISAFEPQDALEESIPTDELSEAGALMDEDRMAHRPPGIPFLKK